jgi:hypothetical protein
VAIESQTMSISTSLDESELKASVMWPMCALAQQVLPQAIYTLSLTLDA